MLKSLLIKNYALIDDIQIDLNTGFTIITGETGAGKSILLGALSLILGQRADAGLLKDKTKKCIVEGVFQITGYNLNTFFQHNELDYNDSLIIRREINPNGVSRSFINDTPVNLTLLKEIGDKLVDIHSQHQNLILSSFQFQIKVVDAFAQHNDKLASFKTKFTEQKELTTEYESLKEKADKAKLDLDYFTFQFNQLYEAKLIEDEQQEMESELEILSHTEEIKGSLDKSSFLLSEEENNIISKLKETENSIASISKFYKDAEELHKRITSVIIELKDIAIEVQTSNSKLEFSPDRLTIIKERLDLIYSLEQKHKVSTVKDLIEIMNNLDKKINDIQSYDVQIEKIQKKIDDANTSLNKTSAEITKKRESIIPQVEKKTLELLQQLGMPNASFKIMLTKATCLNSYGQDNVTFMFSANKNVELQDIAKVASGGELSRVMLCLKSLIAKSVALPTVIFDEIDTGVSGEIGYKMGKIMKKMSEDMQIVSITHLPQVAANGEYHYVIYKDEQGDKTHTNIKLLDNKERITEIAKLLSGKELTETALKNAKEMLEI